MHFWLVSGWLYVPVQEVWELEVLKEEWVSLEQKFRDHVLQLFVVTSQEQYAIQHMTDLCSYISIIAPFLAKIHWIFLLPHPIQQVISNNCFELDCSFSKFLHNEL